MTTSERKQETARQNGARSKGPITEAGKARSSQNALKHGLRARRGNPFLLRNESDAAFARLRASCMAQFSPATEFELTLVDEIALAQWRINRLRAIDVALLDRQMEQQAPELADHYEAVDEPLRTAIAFESLAEHGRAATLAAQHEARLRRAYSQAISLLRQFRRESRAGAHGQNATNEPTTPAESTPPNAQLASDNGFAAGL